MGGFARRMTYWNAFAKKFPSRPMLRLDGGSIFSAGKAESHIANRWTLEGTYRSNLDALNLTMWDLPVWQEMADLVAAGDVPKDFLRLPLVSANVTAKVPNFPAIQRYLIKELPTSGKGGRRLRVGITGLLFDPQERTSRSEFTVQDAPSAARKIVDELMDKTDVRIVLTDMDLGRAISLAVTVPGINFLVVTHNYETISEAQQVGESLLIIPVNEGRMLSEVRLGLLPDSDKIDIHTRLVPLDRTVPDEPKMGELILKAQSALDQFLKVKPPANYAASQRHAAACRFSGLNR